MSKKYGLQFTEEPDFLKYVNDAFKLLKPENDYHVVYFARSAKTFTTLPTNNSLCIKRS